jgi:hypothetical protein
MTAMSIAIHNTKVALQAITTKHLGEKYTDGNPIEASCQAGRAVYPWDDTLSHRDNHAEAVRKHCAMLRWSGTLAYGARADGMGYCFVFMQESLWRSLKRSLMHRAGIKQSLRFSR